MKMLWVYCFNIAINLFPVKSWAFVIRVWTMKLQEVERMQLVLEYFYLMVFVKFYDAVFD